MKNAFFLIAAVLFGLGFLILSSALSPAQAEDIESIWLTTGEWSRHTDDDKHHYRQNNTGIGVQFVLNEDQSVVAGYYHNSIHHETVYAGFAYTPLHIGPTKFGVIGAMATGYYQYLPAVPIGGLLASCEYEKVGVNFMWLPQVVVAIQLRFKIY